MNNLAFLVFYWPVKFNLKKAFLPKYKSCLIRTNITYFLTFVWFTEGNL